MHIVEKRVSCLKFEAAKMFFCGELYSTVMTYIQTCCVYVCLHCENHYSACVNYSRSIHQTCCWITIIWIIWIIWITMSERKFRIWYPVMEEKYSEELDTSHIRLPQWSTKIIDWSKWRQTSVCILKVSMDVRSLCLSSCANATLVKASRVRGIQLEIHRLLSSEQFEGLQIMESTSNKICHLGKPLDVPRNILGRSCEHLGRHFSLIQGRIKAF